MKTLTLILFLLHSNSVLITRIIDGDTVVTSKGERIRLLGINTPERGQCYANEATRFLEDTILNQKVKLTYEKPKQDRYGRTLAWIYHDGLLINGEIVKYGYGVSYRKYPTSKLQELNNLEYVAQYHNRGLWKECQ